MGIAMFVFRDKIKALITILICVFAFSYAFASFAYGQDNSWRIKVKEAALVENDIVTLGDIAEPLGSLSTEDWNVLKTIQLFAAPKESGKPFQISKKKLEESLFHVLGNSAHYLLLPSSLVIQKDGVLFDEQAIMQLVHEELRPKLSMLDGRTELVDFRVPSSIFLPVKGQRLELEDTQVRAGRISLKFYAKEMDGSTVKRYTGTVFLNLWKNVPVPVRPYNRGDMLSPDNLSFAEKNIAHVSGEVWNGKGGPWQFNTAVGSNEAILVSDLSPLAMIRKGQSVDIVYSKGSVYIKQKGEALEDGGPGENINVRNIQSKKQVVGRVVDGQTVELN